MSAEKGAEAAAEGTTAGHLFVPADSLAPRARRGSLASIFGQTATQQAEKDDSRTAVSAKDALPVVFENGMVGNTAAEKLRPTVVKAAPPKKSRKRRKTLHDAETPQTSTRFAECLEVTQSRWVQDPEDPSREIVTLTGEVTSLDSETLDSSFRWIHYHREQTSISFEDFEKVLDKDQGLYEDEAAVASKCIREAKLARRTFARGKYFEPTVHEVSDIMGTDIEKVPIKATFISIPIFALMKASNESLPYLNRHALRTPARHPIRSLLQYSNILAPDTERDKRQVIVVTKLREDERPDTKPFIHVPELWMLVINMYTVITCAPFTSQALLGENIQLVKPPANRQRFIVKFTSLRGTLHDLRCQTWFGLLEAISRIEWHIKDIDIQLNDPETEFKLIDQKYRSVDESRWMMLADAKETRQIAVRLVRIPEDTKLTLEFAAKKLRDCVSATWVLLGLPYQEDVLEAKLEKALARSAPQHEIDTLQRRLEGLAEMERKFKRSRYFNRMLLYAARAHILNPRESQGTSRKAKTRRAFGRVVMASKLSTFPEASNLAPKMNESVSSKAPVFYENRLKIPDIAIRRASDASTVTNVSNSAPPVNLDPPRASRISNAAEGEANVLGRTSGQFIQVSPPWVGVESGLDAKVPVGASQYTDSFTSQHPYSRPGTSTQRKVALWAPTADMSLDRLPLTTEGRIIPAIVDPYSPGHSALGGIDYAPIKSPPKDSKNQLLRPRAAGGRRHSSFGVAGEVLAASPMRLPLRAEDRGALARSPALSLTPPESNSQLPQRSFDPELASGERPQIRFPPDQDIFPVTVSEKVAKRAKDVVGGRKPFFQWRTHQSPSSVINKKDMRASIGSKSERMNTNHADPRRGTEANPSESHAANEILADIDSFIIHGKYHDAPKFDVSPSDYEDIVNRKRSEVIALMQTHTQESARPSVEIGPDDNDPAVPKRQLADSKMKLLLAVNGLLECFVSQDEVEAAVLGKIWGLMYNLCNLQPEQAAAASDFDKFETHFVHYAAKEVEKMEFKCGKLLHVNHQLESTNDHSENAGFRVPPPLFAAFMDFILFLLSTHLAVSELRVNEETVNTIKDKVHHGLHQSQSIFLRMNEHLEMDLDQIGYESIRTADSILGLLLENALSISCRESGAGIAGDDTEMDFDIVETYSRYTAHAIDRAKQEASARVYEDIRLLREEIDTIRLVLTHQFTLFQRVLTARESALQNLDKRFIYRVRQTLDEMIRHFATLGDYAVQAEFWARNSIEVRSENNNKAIYVFTAVTVIFLPLTFVTGLLGMNTFDIRNLTHGQWLFWAVALPFTFIVLIICLCIVNYKFKLKRRVRRFFLRGRAVRWGRRVTRRVRDAYFHAGHMGYGLRVLVPFGLVQRWRVRNMRRKSGKGEERRGLKRWEDD